MNGIASLQPSGISSSFSISSSLHILSLLLYLGLSLPMLALSFPCHGLLSIFGEDNIGKEVDHETVIRLGKVGNGKR